MSGRRNFMALACCLAGVLALLNGRQLRRADAPPPRASRSPARPATGPYCGVYCLYAAARALGVEVSLEELVDSRYITSLKGSRPDDLEAAAEACGVHCQPVSGLTAASLRASHHPVILHVRLPGRGTDYNHWVLFLGIEGDRARVLDPPHPVDLWPFPELMACSDGIGLIVTKEPAGMALVHWATWVERSGSIALVFLSLLTVRALWLGKASRTSRITHSWSGARLVLRALGLVSLACGLAWAYDRLHTDGLSSNPVATAHVAAQHFDIPVGSVSLVEVKAVLNEPSVVLIDARLPGDYDRGHIRHAINLPIFTDRASRERALALVPLTHRLIVYCQSERCPWASAVASQLVLRGYCNVAIFRGGWNEWREHHEQAKH